MGDAIDAEITRVALQAETATAAKSFGYPWSPTLAEVGQQVTFWKNCFCSAKHCQDPFLHLIPSQLQHHDIYHVKVGPGLIKSRSVECMTEPSMRDAMVLELAWDQVEKWILTMFS